MLPLQLLKAAQGHPVVSPRSPAHRFCENLSPESAATLQLVELKSGETYNGHMVLCDSWMNVHLKEVICTSKVSGLCDGISKVSCGHQECANGPACRACRMVTVSGVCQRRTFAATPSSI